MRSGPFRGILEWKNDDIPLGTTNNYAARLYDASVSQYVGWYDDPNMDGGLGGTLTRMLQEDPNFVSGRCLYLGLSLLDKKQSYRIHPEFKAEVDQLLKDVADNQSLPYREKKHAEAIGHWAGGNLKKACLTWEDILLEHPTDMHALKFAGDTYFYLGRQREMRDSVARVMPYWTSRAIPLQSYLHGMYAFGLVETSQYLKAEKEAKKGLDRNSNDAWATHALAHVYEMDTRFDEGINMLRATEDNWKVCNHLATHNYWHLALYHIEQGNHEAAGEIFSGPVMNNLLKVDSMLNIHDASSLGLRMEMDDHAKASPITSNLWPTIADRVAPYTKNHVVLFDDVHFLFALIGSKRFAEAEEMIQDFEKNVDDISMPSKYLYLPVMKAVLAYGLEDYRTVVELLNPIRYKIHRMGGSDAQRDILCQMLINSAMRSRHPQDKKMVEHLLIERSAQKDNSPLTNRLTLKLRSY